MLTVGADGFPNVAYTWAAAPDAYRLRFSADHGSGTLKNLKRNGQSSLHFAAGDDTLYLVKGQSRMIKERIEAAPFGISMMELSISDLKDQSWSGVTVEPLSYRWPEHQRLEMQAVEEAVYAEMIKNA